MAETTRRTVLSAVAAVGATAIAGCGQSGDGDESDEQSPAGDSETEAGDGSQSGEQSFFEYLIRNEEVCGPNPEENQIAVVTIRVVANEEIEDPEETIRAALQAEVRELDTVRQGTADIERLEEAVIANLNDRLGQGTVEGVNIPFYVTDDYDEGYEGCE